jgi:hypothetical protein
MLQLATTMVIRYDELHKIFSDYNNCHKSTAYAYLPDMIFSSVGMQETEISTSNFLYDDYHLPEDDNHHSHRRGNLKSYNFLYLRRIQPYKCRLISGYIPSICFLLQCSELE